MRVRMKELGLLATAVGFLFLLPVSAQGVNLTVRCGAREGLSTINVALQTLNQAGPNTLFVSGTCKENVLIRGFDRLTLIAKTGAAITDASGGTGVVLDIEDSTHVTLRGFSITGGTIGVFCGNFSICRLEGNTVSGASGVGVQVVQSRATFGPNTIERNGVGLTSLESSSIRTFGGLVIQQNLVSGVDLDTGSSFASFGDNIRDNSGNGIEANNHASLLMLGTTVTGNLFNGVVVLGQSAADLESGNMISGKCPSGVLGKDVNFAEFRLPSTVTGNGSGLDVACLPQYPATRGALTNLGGGITNCVEP